MFEKLVMRIKSALGVVNKKAELVMGLEELNKLVKTDLMESNTSMMAFLKTGLGIENILVAMQKFDSTIKTNKQAVKWLDENYRIIEELGKTLQEMFVENFNTVIVTDSMSAKEVALYSLSETFNFLVGAHSDLLVYLSYASTDTFIYKKKEEWVNKELKEYIVTIRGLKKETLKKTFKNIDELSDVVVTSNPSLINELTSKKDRSLVIPRNNFDGNPLTIFGKWIVDLKVSRADKLEYDKKLIKLKLISLKEIEQNGGVTTALSQQIEYYEAKIVSLDKEIVDLLGD